jgi:hypothetical protein
MIKRQQGTAFFDMLDAEQKENFINEFSSQYSDASVNKYLSQEYSDFHHFIGGAFVFSSTSQGFKYWSDIREGVTREDNDKKVDKLLEGLESALQILEMHSKEETVHFICGKEFYDLMNREERTEFHSEFLRQRDGQDFDGWLNETHYQTFNEFVSASFVWAISKRGLMYWSDVSTKYNFNEVYETLGELNIVTDGAN